MISSLWDYDSIRYECKCPSSDDIEVETLDHLLRCPDPVHIKWQRTLRVAVRKECEARKTDEVLIDIFDKALGHWFDNTPFPTHAFSPVYQPLLNSQKNIGWKLLFYGRFLIEWQKMQLRSLNLRNIEPKRRNSGSSWLRAIIHII